MSAKPKCPKCGSNQLAVERRPDGDASCITCKWSGPYKGCFGPGMEDLRYEVDLLRIIALQLDRWRTAWASQDTSDAEPARRTMFKALDYWKDFKGEAHGVQEERRDEASKLKADNT